MESTTTFHITGDLKVVFTNSQLNTKIYIANKNGNNFVCLDIDKWTEFKKNIFAIDKEFYSRLHSQFLIPLPNISYDGVHTGLSRI